MIYPACSTGCTKNLFKVNSKDAEAPSNDDVLTSNCGL